MTTTQQDGIQTFTGSALEELLPQIRQQLGEDAIILARRDGTAGGFGGFFARRTVEVDAMPATVPASASIDVSGDDADPYAEDRVPGPAAFGIDAYAAPRAATPAGAASPTQPAPAGLDGPAGPDEPADPTGVPPRDALEAAAAFDAAAAALRRAAPRPADDNGDGDAAQSATPPAPRLAPREAAAFAEQLAGLMGDRPPPAAPLLRPTVVPGVDAMPGFVTAGGDAPDPAPDPAPRAAPAPSPDPAPGWGTVPAPIPGLVKRSPAADLDDADALVQASAPAVEPPAAAFRVPVAPGLGPDGAELLATGLSAALAAELVHTAGAHVAPLAQDSSPRGVLRTALAARIPVAAPVRGPGGAVIGFVGPGGSGKTRCVARLATAYARRSQLPVACISLRPLDGGAELAALLGPAGVPVHAEDDVAAAAQRIGALRAGTIVLLDTPGVSPRAEAELRTLAADLRRLAADELHLTVPATIGALAARELATAGRQLGVVGIALTHADETAALGTVVELAIDTGVPLTYVARGTALDGGMRPAAADALAFAMLGPVDRDDELV
ncbi:hypothetical protein DSM112329_00077 [Paraconexibacter sp. AEG42_29]|uniref:SRP54-type proteins GTP-binding domain-containing protein n=1 Tax=Paraconexibacter sp. AEG42_29 TaxID=2997339 RepID=A0AAU7ANP0_9ACTN